MLKATMLRLQTAVLKTAVSFLNIQPRLKKTEILPTPKPTRVPSYDFLILYFLIQVLKKQAIRGAGYDYILLKP